MNRNSSIIIETYDSSWPTRFETERHLLLSVLAPWLVGPVEHVGSTAVPGLAAKPVIDIMAGVGDLRSSVDAIEALKPLSYCYAAYKADVMHWFCKPDPFNRTHHLHLVPFEGLLWRERLAFRDCLRANATIGRAYADLKVQLAAKHGSDRDAYTEAKTGFIQSTLKGIHGEHR